MLAMFNWFSKHAILRLASSMSRQALFLASYVPAVLQLGLANGGIL